MLTPVEVGAFAGTYAECWQHQREVHAQIVAGARSRLLIGEHQPVYTLGRQSHMEHLLRDANMYRQMGAELHEVDRGGDVTFHGPGQLVAYPILRLSDFPCGQDLHKYLRALEACLVDLLQGYGLSATTLSGKTGVWVDGAKVAAIGVKCARWVTMHGIALNLNTDLAWFSHIVPCGLHEPVTSLQLLLGDDACPTMAELRLAFVKSFERTFCCACITDAG